jgi:hypothetical protein
LEHLILAAENGGAWLMLARIGVLKALHCGVVREFKSDRRETNWGKRKLKRDQRRSPARTAVSSLFVRMFTDTLRSD